MTVRGTAAEKLHVLLLPSIRVRMSVRKFQIVGRVGSEERSTDVDFIHNDINNRMDMDIITFWSMRLRKQKGSQNSQ